MKSLLPLSASDSSRVTDAVFLSGQTVLILCVTHAMSSTGTPPVMSTAILKADVGLLPSFR